MVVAFLGIEDSVTCGRPSESTKAFSCGAADGGWVVVNIRLDDVDFGLLVREGPSLQTIGKPIPPNGTGVTVSGTCNPETPETWCEVQCRSLGLKGWARARYLRPHSQALYSVTATPAADSPGLTIRTGPHQTCRPAAVIPLQARDVIQHWCQRSPLDTTIWCRISYDRMSGWILDGSLERKN
jgi:hypothetical protein